MPIGNSNITFGGLRNEYNPSGTNANVDFGSYYRGGSFVEDSVTTPADLYGTITKPPGVSNAWPPVASQYAENYCMWEFIFRKLNGDYLDDTLTGTGQQTPIVRRWYWGQTTPNDTNMDKEKTYYGAANADAATSHPNYTYLSGGQTWTVFTPDLNYPFNPQPVQTWQVLVSSTAVTLTPAAANMFLGGVGGYGGTENVNWWTNKFGTWKAESTPEVTNYYNTTVPESGQISLNNFKSQGNP